MFNCALYLHVNIPQFFSPSFVLFVQSLLLLLFFIFQLARDGDAITLKRLINQIMKRKKKALNALDENGISPLHYAARYNHLPVVKMLVDNGAGRIFQYKFKL